VQLLVYREKSRGKWTHPWIDLLLMIQESETGRKSVIQLQVESGTLAGRACPAAQLG